MAILAVLAAIAVVMFVTDSTPARADVYTPPDHKRVERHFHPWDHPTRTQINVAAHSEQQRWGGQSVLGRIACESRFDPNATNGQYQGLGQIGPIWGYLTAGMPRDVKLVTRKTVTRPVLEITADPITGGTEVKKIGKKKVRVKLVRKGKIPGSASPYHGYAAIRVLQRAVSGHASTSWSCGL